MALIRSKGTKHNPNTGPFGRLRKFTGAGKGDIISGTFGSGWVKNAEDRLSQRRYACTAIDCGKLKPSGKCEFCGHEPSGNKGW